MKLAIVGSRTLEGNAEAAKAIEEVLDRYKPDEVISGGAVGIDQMAEKAAAKRKIFLRIFIPVGTGWPAYKARNLEIAQACDKLVRIAGKTAKSYGSGWTRDRVAQMGKPTEEIVI